jgi:hypothetical protein
MNRNIRDAKVKRYYCDTHARRLDTLECFTPYKYLCYLWTQTPGRFTVSPFHQMPRPNT